MATPAPAPRPELDCAEARERTRAFAAGELDTAATRELRGHLAGCTECKANYAEAMRTTAALGQLGAQARQQRTEERRKQAAHARHFGRQVQGQRRERNWRLRLILIPAFFIWLMTQIAGVGGSSARVEVVSHLGEVSVDGRPVAPEKQPALVLPGRWVTTRAFAKAELDGRACRVELGERSELLVESARPVRFRLRRGRLDVEGDLTVVTVLGLVEVEGGRGRLTLDDAGLALEPESGAWTFYDDSGERALAPGEPLRVRPPFERLP